MLDNAQDHNPGQAGDPDEAVQGESTNEVEDSGTSESHEGPAGDAPAEVQTEEAAQPTRRRQRSTAGTRPARSRRAATSAESESPDGTASDDDGEDVPSPRLREMYRNEIIPNMMREFGFDNPMEVPRVKKIVLNIGLGEALTNGRAMESAVGDLSTITGQKPVITRARRSIAGFKIREGNPIGTSVTLRGGRMYHFLDRLINTALPRIRDFRGLPRRGFDGRGNFSIGIREQIIFPEIDYNQIDRLRGLQVTITTSAKNDSEAVRLLELYGMPFVKET